MKQIKAMVLLLIALTLCPKGTLAEEEKKPSPWGEKYSLTLGYFISNLDTGLRLGAGLGVDIDAEDALNLEETMSVARLEGYRRFGKHRVDLSWMSLNRKAMRTAGESFTFENNQGEQVTVAAGANVESYLNLNLYKLTYSYSFIQDDRLDLAAALGVYIAPIEVGIAAQGTVNDQEIANERSASSFTAPLPMLGLRMDIAVTPKWFVRYQGQIFYLEYESFKGSLYSSTMAVEYKPWQHVGFGLGYDLLKMMLEAKKNDYPEIDFKGKINFQYTGLMLYCKLFF
ncbi:MAG: hypothetical protein M0036_16020 [Desulfobacteraceae bacterium]|nr:hypothetical protein [Desulfobacteraceae bacterium]